MTLAEIRPPVQTAPPSNTWVNATWEEFVAIADDPTSEKKTCYYYDRQIGNAHDPIFGVMLT